MDDVKWAVARMQPLVDEWDIALRAALPAYARLGPESETRGSLLRNPAPEAQIAAAEERLGVRLPPSYRSFLAISDGADAGGMGPTEVCRIFGRSDDVLVPISEVRGLDEATRGVASGWRDAFRGLDLPQTPAADGGPVDVVDFRPGPEGLLITLGGQLRTVGLVPFPDEWQVWEFDHAEVRAHRSFATFLQFQTGRARATIARRRKVAMTDNPDSWTASDVRELAACGDLRAAEAACRLLLVADTPEGHKSIAARTLVCLGVPATIPHVRQALHDYRARRADALTRVDAEQRHTAYANPQLEVHLLQALDSAGAPDILDELHCSIATNEPPVSDWIVRHLESRDALTRW